MEAFYEGDEKGEDDRKEEGKEVKPWGRFYFTVVLFGEITYYIFSTHPAKAPKGTVSV